jgi:hypothetical protein
MYIILEKADEIEKASDRENHWPKGFVLQINTDVHREVGSSATAREKNTYRQAAPIEVESSAGTGDQFPNWLSHCSPPFHVPS